jgi:hypothetical protein
MQARTGHARMSVGPAVNEGWWAIAERRVIYASDRVAPDCVAVVLFVVLIGGVCEDLLQTLQRLPSGLMPAS